MPIRRALAVLFVAAVLATAAGCSRDNQDWRSAQAADTVEGYDDFVAKHPQSEFAVQARSRVKQLGEERDWERATVADSAEVYQQFLTQHPDGKWAQEARIRIENFNVLNTGAAKPAAAAGAAAAAVTPGARPAAGAVPSSAKPPAASVAPSMPVPASAVAKVTAAAKPAAQPKAGTARKVEPVTAVNAAPKSARSVATGAHRIQLGAFSSKAKANLEWKRVSGAYSDLQGLTSQVIAAQTSAGKLYRLQVSVASKDRGRAICKALAAHKQPCIYVHH